MIRINKEFERASKVLDLFLIMPVVVVTDICSRFVILKSNFILLLFLFIKLSSLLCCLPSLSFSSFLHLVSFIPVESLGWTSSSLCLQIFPTLIVNFAISQLACCSLDLSVCPSALSSQLSGSFNISSE